MTRTESPTDAPDSSEQAGGTVSIQSPAKKSHKPVKGTLAVSARVVLVADFAAACDRHDYVMARKLADEAEKMGKPLSAGMLGRLPDAEKT